MIVVPRTEHGARGLYQCKDGYVLKVADDVDDEDADGDNDDCSGQQHYNVPLWGLGGHNTHMCRGDDDDDYCDDDDDGDDLGVM